MKNDVREVYGEYSVGLPFVVYKGKELSYEINSKAYI